MSFTLIRNRRYFGELHKIFASNPIFPEERVKPDIIHPGTSSARGQRDRRIHLLLKKEKLNTMLKQYVYGVRENDFLLREKGIPTREEGSKFISCDVEGELAHIKLDELTNLPSGLGYNEVIKEVRDSGLSEASQDKLRDIWVKMGFFEPSQFISSTSGGDIGDSEEKINRRLFTNRHKITPSPYKTVYNDRDPKSEKLNQDEPEFYSMSSDDILRPNVSTTAFERAKEKYEKTLMEMSDDEIVPFPADTTTDDIRLSEDETKIDTGFEKLWKLHPLVDRYTFKKLNERDTNKVKHNIRIAGRETVKKLKKRLPPLFKMMDRNDAVRKQDFDYTVSSKVGMVPSFAEIIAEAEEIIKEDPILNRQSIIDEYKKNVNFEPRYFNKQMSVEDFSWSFMPKRTESVYPGFISGNYNFRLEPETLLKYDNIVETHLSQPYSPKTNDMSRKALVMIKNDPNHEHYLNNHLMFWFDDKRRPMNFEGYGKVSKTIPAMPWEYLKVEKPSALKLQKDLKVEKDEEGYVSAKGKRKRAHAVVKVKYGNGNIIINGKSLIEFCVNIVCRDRIIRPLLETKLAGYIDIKAEVTGGGIMGQSFALRQALGTALIRMIPASSRVICSNGFLRKDPRQVERKKTSKFKARKAYTYVKR